MKRICFGLIQTTLQMRTPLLLASREVRVLLLRESPLKPSANIQTLMSSIPTFVLERLAVRTVVVLLHLVVQAAHFLLASNSAPRPLLRLIQLVLRNAFL